MKLPISIIILGEAGAGKTTIGVEIARHLKSLGFDLIYKEPGVSTEQIISHLDKAIAAVVAKHPKIEINCETIMLETGGRAPRSIDQRFVGPIRPVPSLSEEEFRHQYSNTAIGARMNLRYVLFIEGRGVYIGCFQGRAYWSLDINPTQDAPTFANQAEADAEITHHLIADKGSRLIEVIPDLPGNRVSATACGRRGMPWNERTTAAPTRQTVPGTLNPPATAEDDKANGAAAE